MTLTKAELQRLAELCDAATPGEWFWNSYAAISAAVPKGHPLDVSDEDDPGFAVIAFIDGGPKQRGHGDELRVPEAKGNAAFIAEARTAVPALLAELERVTRERDEAVGLIEFMNGNLLITREEPKVREFLARIDKEAGE